MIFFPLLSALTPWGSLALTGPNLVSTASSSLRRTERLNFGCKDVTSQGNGKYQFLRSTTCEIIPKLTTSQVTYANGALNATVLSSTPLSSHNTNLSLFLASVVQYQSMNSQGLGSNSIGDALYAIAAFTDIVSDDDATLSAGLIAELVGV